MRSSSKSAASLAPRAFSSSWRLYSSSICFCFDSYIIMSRIFFYSAAFACSCAFYFRSTSRSFLAYSSSFLSNSSRSLAFFSLSSARNWTYLSSTSRTCCTFYTCICLCFLCCSSCSLWPNFWISPHSSSLISEGMFSTSSFYPSFCLRTLAACYKLLLILVVEPPSTPPLFAI